MSVSIRLARTGKKFAPAYRVVVAKTKTKRNGRFIEVIGNFNPSDPTQDFVIDKKSYEEWVKKGAIVTDAVKKLVDGTYEYVKYDPRTKKTEAETPKEPEIEEESETPQE